MVHCWDEYMWKVHKALPMDPWADNVQLLDVLIQERCSSSQWLPSWLRPREKSSHMARVGSIFNLGAVQDSLNKTAWKREEVNGKVDEHPLSGALKENASGNPNVDDAVVPPVSNVDNAAALDLCKFLPIKSSSMPDIQASIKSSTSLLGSFRGGSSASAQFNVKGSKTVSCNVSGVKSRRVDTDALLKVVTPSSSSAWPVLWRPDIDLPQLSWCSKRGQTLYVVVEIMYANKIRIEAANQGQANTEVNVTKGQVNVSETTEAGFEKDGLWLVIAAPDNPMFPLAFRLQRLDYDAFGNLITNFKVGNKKPLQRNSSTHITKLPSSKPPLTLSRSVSVSPVFSHRK